MPKNKYFKVVIIGDLQVGKKSIFDQLRRSEPEHPLDPFGIYSVLKMDNNDRKFRITLYRYFPHSGMNIRSAFYRGASVAIIVYDVSKKQTLENIGTWIQEYWKKNPKRPTSIIVVGNKIDLKKRAISVFELDEKNEILQKFSEENKMHIPKLEVSAQTGENCDKLLNLVIERCANLD